MVGDHVAQKIEPKQRHLRQHASFIGDAGGKNVIESGDAVRSDDQQTIAVLIDIAHFSPPAQLQAGHMRFEQHTVPGHISLDCQSQLY